MLCTTIHHPPRRTTSPIPWPAARPRSRQVTWPEFLALAAEACERAYPGSPGRFLGAYIHALASQATLLQADSPEAHEAAAEAVRVREAAYLHALEQGAASWSLAEPDLSDDANGGWGGHPDADWFASQGDAGTSMRAWLGDPACDDTYMN